jgi:hypothetical protein
MSNTFHHGERRRGQRQIRVRGVRHDPPDLRKLARALIAIAQAQAEHEARAEHQEPHRKHARQDGDDASDDSADQHGDAT